MLQSNGSFTRFLFAESNVNRRLEDKIRHLCEVLIATDYDAEEFPFLARELKLSLKEHIERIRSQVLAYPPAKDRRSA
jgi:hypothetical protein